MRTFAPLVAAISLVSPAVAGLTPTHLKCEYKTNPLAVGAARPRLSWWVESAERGQKQTAYRILAGSRPGASDLWDSGKVSSSETLHIPYVGKALSGGQQVFWRVQVWDKDGQITTSRVAQFTRALDVSEWKSDWIEAPKAPTVTDIPNLKAASWIWRNDGANPPKASRWFRMGFVRPASAAVKIAITADDGYQIFLNGKEVPGARGGSWKEAQVHDLSSASVVGANVLEVRAENGEPGPAGVLATLKVGSREYPSGIDWTASTDRQNWERVNVVAAYGAAPWGEPTLGTRNAMTPPPVFRGQVHVMKPLKRALLYATALGVYDLTLNGKKFDNDVLSPGWTDFAKRAHFHAYDVTRALKTGANVLDAQLGDGWYASYLAFTGRRRYYGGDPKLRLELRLEYADGTIGHSGTDGSWEWANNGVQTADLLMGTDTDTRVKIAPSDWKPVAGDVRAADPDPAAPRRADAPRSGDPGVLPRRAEAQDLRLQPRAEPDGLGAADGDGKARPEDHGAPRRAPEPRRHGVLHEPESRESDRHVRSGRWQADRRAEVHVPRLPVRRDHRPGHCARAERRRRNPGVLRDGADAVFLHRQRASQQACEQHRLGLDRQRARRPDRLPPARRARRLDGRRPGVLQDRDAPSRRRELLSPSGSTT